MKLRILHIVPNFGDGGAERRVSDLLSFTNQDQFEVAACSLFSPSGARLEEELAQAGMRIWWLNKHLGPDPRMLFSIARVLREFSPHVVHTHRYVLRYSLLPTMFQKIPVRLHTVCNQAEHEVDRPGILIHRFAFSYGRVLPVSISEQIKMSVQATYGGIASPLILNAIDTARFQLNGDADKSIRSDLKIKDQLVLLHVGRFQRQKNHRLLIEAFSQVREVHDQTVLLLAGDGPLRIEIEEEVKKRGLDEVVHFLGVRKDIPQLLAAADVFVLSSDWEGVPRSALEAMASGTPVVSTAVGGVPDAVADGVSGLLVPRDDAVSLARAIKALLTDSALRHKLGKQAAQAAGRFDVRTIVKDYEALYRELWDQRQLAADGDRS